MVVVVVVVVVVRILGTQHPHHRVSIFLCPMSRSWAMVKAGKAGYFGADEIDVPSRYLP